jgi:hypothetical protein
MTSEYEQINLATNIERTYSSFMRNCIIIFTLGITIINLTKRRKTEKFMLSFILIFAGILLGIISTFEFYSRIKLIEDGQYDIYKGNLVSKTIWVYMFIILLFILLFGYTFINFNEQYKMVDAIKKSIK